MLLAGLGCLLSGALPGPAAWGLAQRTVPVLLFVLAMTLVTELADDAGLFRTLTGSLARWAGKRGSVLLLWVMVLGLSVLSTIFLSLDTTAVLITPMVVLLALHARLPAMPFALTTVWLANTASLLLPVSNLSNLLAQHRLNYSPWQFASALWAPALIGIIVPIAALWLLFRKDFRGSFTPEPAPRPRDRTLLLICAVVVAVLLPLLVSGIPVEYPALAAALVLLLAFALRRPGALSWRMVPWRPLMLAAGLFLLVETLQSRGLPQLLAAISGPGEGYLPLLQLAGLGAASANVVNNLPAYLALEPVADSPIRLAALLIGVNLGPLLTPWASLATVLWHERLKNLGVEVSWLRFAGLGLLLVVVLIPLAVLALWLSAGLPG
nr:SLC13 family permease [Psychromicrobium silvestre]